MKKILLTAAVLGALVGAPLVASAASPNGQNGVFGAQHSAERHNPTALVHFPSWRGTQSMTVAPAGEVTRTGRMCDQSKNGAAYLDACSPDGMAAGGSNFGGGRLK